MRDLFERIEAKTAASETLFLVHVSYVELYNNQFRNLLEGYCAETASEQTAAHLHASNVRQQRFGQRPIDLVLRWAFVSGT